MLSARRQTGGLSTATIQLPKLQIRIWLPNLHRRLLNAGCINVEQVPAEGESACQSSQQTVGAHQSSPRA